MSDNSFKNNKVILKIIIGAFILLVLVIVLFPNNTKTILRGFLQKYDTEYYKQISRYDSIQNLRNQDSIKFVRLEGELKKELNTLIQDYKQEIQKLKLRQYKNEQELFKYRNSLFNNKFELFTRAVTGENNLQR